MIINKVVILKDALMIGEEKIVPPFKKEKIDSILGCPKKYQNEIEKDAIQYGFSKETIFTIDNLLDLIAHKYINNIFWK